MTLEEMGLYEVISNHNQVFWHHRILTEFLPYFTDLRKSIWLWGKTRLQKIMMVRCIEQKILLLL